MYSAGQGLTAKVPANNSPENTVCLSCLLQFFANSEYLTYIIIGTNSVDPDQTA